MSTIKKSQWAAVYVDNKTKLVVSVKNFIRLDIDNYNEKKKYSFHHKGRIEIGLILGLFDHRKDALDFITTKRTSVPPKQYLMSASEGSDDNSRHKKDKIVKPLISQENVNSKIADMKKMSEKRQMYNSDDSMKKPLKKPKIDHKSSHLSDNHKNEQHGATETGQPPEVLTDASKSAKIKKMDENNTNSKNKVSKVEIKAIETYPASDNGVPPATNVETIKTLLKEKNELRDIIERQIQKIKQYEAEINELKNLNQLLQTEVIEGQKKIMDFMREHDSKKNTGDSQEIETDLIRIGSESDNHKKVYIGLDHWMDKEVYKTAMDSRRATLFVNTMAVYIFGTDTLMKSTVTGNTSRRSKDIKDDVEKPLKLPQDGITILRGMLKHYLNTSVWYKNFDSLSKDSIAGKLKEFLTTFISNIKASKNKIIKNNKNIRIKNNSNNENDKSEQEKDDDSLQDDNFIVEDPEDTNENDLPEHATVVVKNKPNKKSNDDDRIEESSDGEDQVDDGTEKELENVEIDYNSTDEDDTINKQTTATKLKQLKSRHQKNSLSDGDSEDD